MNDIIQYDICKMSITAVIPTRAMSERIYKSLKDGNVKEVTNEIIKNKKYKVI